MRGFGFLRDATGRRYFVHVTALKDGIPLERGEEVVFTPVETDRGLRATYVQRAPSRCPKCGDDLRGAAQCGGCGFTLEAAYAANDDREGGH